MYAILDVCYERGCATVACVRFGAWTDSEPIGLHLTRLDAPADYVPGRFFERELPCLTHALEREEDRFDVIVVDGFVHLKPPTSKGLGRHLAESLPYQAAVIGVAKNPLQMADRYVEVLRGRSARPLFVSAVDMPVERAAALIRNMAGDHRIPSLIRLADRACRGR